MSMYSRYFLKTENKNKTGAYRTNTVYYGYSVNSKKKKNGKRLNQIR